METNLFGLIGSGSQALEVMDFSNHANVAFILSNDKEQVGGSIQGVPVYDFEQPPREAKSIGVIPAVGAPGLKQKLISEWSGTLAAALCAETAFISPNATVDPGTIVAPNSVVMANVHIRQAVLINVGATVSHHTTIGDFSTISPGVNIGGNCTLGAGVFVGIGATIIQGIEVAPGSYIGAGAVVTKNITTPGTYVGIPAKFVNESNIWATSL